MSCSLQPALPGPRTHLENEYAPLSQENGIDAVQNVRVKAVSEPTRELGRGMNWVCSEGRSEQLVHALART